MEELNEEKQQLHAKVEAEIVEVEIQQDLECQQLIHDLYCVWFLWFTIWLDHSD